MKYLIVLAVVVVGLWLLLGRASGRGTPVARRPPPPQPPPPASPVHMLACARCGVHLPGDEAVRDAHGRAFCCEAHRNAGPG